MAKKTLTPTVCTFRWQSDIINQYYVNNTKKILQKKWVRKDFRGMFILTRENVGTPQSSLSVGKRTSC